MEIAWLSVLIALSNTKLDQAFFSAFIVLPLFASFRFQTLESTGQRSLRLRTGNSCRWRTRATRCITANVLQTKVDAHC